MKFYVAHVGGLRVLEHRKDEAKKLDPNFEQIDIPTSLHELKAYVQALFDQIDKQNVEPIESPDFEDNAPINRGGVEECGFIKPEGHTERAVRFEDEFDNMSLALQLHYAARAMENARERL